MIHARLFWPERHDAPARALPAVVVSPGYMANARYMYIPWASDITNLGAVALIVDRRGQGRSGGDLWQREPKGASLDDLHADLAAAIAYLRSLAPKIDPGRIALLGHSDGATAALIAGSADWEVRATIAVSPSTGPWQYVNHVAPQNMLLVFGADDSFVLDDTDTALISRATRLGLVDEGRVGDLHVGDGRGLVRVPGRGHLDVLTDTTTRIEVREWLKRALNTSAAIEPIRTNGSRSHWLTFGVVALGLCLYRPARLQAGNRHRPREANGPTLRYWSVILAVGIAWGAGLWVSGESERILRPLLPGQETSAVVALIMLPCAALALIAMGVRLFFRRGDFTLAAPARDITRKTIFGLFVAAGVIFALKLLLWSHYEVTLTPARGVVLLVLAGVLLPSLAVLLTSLRQIAAIGIVHEDEATRLVGWSLIVGALLTAGLTPWLFTRMGMAGSYVTATALATAAAYHVGLGSGSLVSTAAFGGGLMAAATAMACVLY